MGRLKIITLEERVVLDAAAIAGVHSVPHAESTGSAPPLVFKVFPTAPLSIDPGGPIKGKVTLPSNDTQQADPPGNETRTPDTPQIETSHAGDTSQTVTAHPSLETSQDVAYHVKLLDDDFDL